MKFRAKQNPQVVIEAFQWDAAKPASSRPEWFNQKVNSGEVLIEMNDSVTLPFPAARSALPGEFIVKTPTDELVSTSAAQIKHGWDPVEE